MTTTIQYSYDDLIKRDQPHLATIEGLKSRLEQIEEMLRFLQKSRFAAKSESWTHPG
jgi:hypothetical protein